MKRQTILAITSLSILFCVGFRGAHRTVPSDILGVYWTPDKDGKIEMYRADDGDFHGKLVWSLQPELKDIHNPDPSLRQTLLLGSDIFRDLTYDAEDQAWQNGKVYDTRDGKTYGCEMWLEQSGQILKVRGFLGLSLFGVTKDFERVK